MKCTRENCGKTLLIGDEIFVIRRPDNGLLYPFCSAECVGLYLTQYSIELTEELEEKLDKAKRQDDISEILEDEL